VKVSDKGQSGTDAIDIVNPFYAGIDVHFQFSGVEKLKIFTNNNITFSGVQGVDPADKKTVYGFDDSAPGLGKDVKEGWFAMFNSLGVTYDLTEKLTAAFQLANLLGVLSGESPGTKTSDSTNKFCVTASTLYAFNANVSLEGGIAMMAEGGTVDNGTTKTDKGIFSFGIPLRFKVSF
jgi:hypothetical protein